jgi:hypothetical protein
VGSPRQGIEHLPTRGGQDLTQVTRVPSPSPCRVCQYLVAILVDSCNGGDVSEWVCHNSVTFVHTRYWARGEPASMPLLGGLSRPRFRDQVIIW